jgi:arylformamidase
VNAVVPTYDVTMPIRTGMPTFPGDPVPTVEPERSIDLGHPYRISTLVLGTHTGTHLDPPSHFLRNGKTLDEIDLALLHGPCEVVRIAAGQSSIFPKDLASLPPGTERVLFHSSNSERWSAGEGYFPDFVDLSPPAAAELLRRGVRLVGVDALSVESDPTMEYPVHRALLEREAVILEGLVMTDVPAGRGSLRCLPLRVARGDGGPCRALVDTE